MREKILSNSASAAYLELFKQWNHNYGFSCLMVGKIWKLYYCDESCLAPLLLNVRVLIKVAFLQLKNVIRNAWRVINSSIERLVETGIGLEIGLYFHKILKWSILMEMDGIIELWKLIAINRLTSCYFIALWGLIKISTGNQNLTCRSTLLKV